MDKYGAEVLAFGTDARAVEGELDALSAARSGKIPAHSARVVPP